MTGLRLFAHGCLYQYRALFNWATPLGYASSKLLVPVFQVVFFVQLGVFATGGGDPTYFAIGNAMQVTALNGIFGVVMTVGNERQFGTLPLLLASPASRLATFLGRSAFHVVDGIISVVIAFAVAQLLFGLRLAHADLPLLAASVVAVALSTCGIGLLLGSCSLVSRDILLVANLVYFLFLVVAGVNFPVTRLPGALQVVSRGLPMSRGIAAARLAVAGAPASRALPLLGQELLVGAAYAAAGYLLFRVLEGWARRGGLQEAF